MHNKPTYTIKNLREIAENTDQKELLRISSTVREEKELYSRDDFMKALDILSDEIIRRTNKMMSKIF